MFSRSFAASSKISDISASQIDSSNLFFASLPLCKLPITRWQLTHPKQYTIHSRQSKTDQLRGSTALATVLVLARFITRVHTKVGFKADAYAILAALVFIQMSNVEKRLGS